MQRDLTRAIVYAHLARDTESPRRRGGYFKSLIGILEQMDGRTGRRDPTVRSGKRPAVRTSAPKSAKKARRR